MDTDTELRRQILRTLETKSLAKAEIYRITSDIFQELKNSLHEMSGEINEELTNSRMVKIEYRDKGKFEAQLQVAGDILLFTMHTNVFNFDPAHRVWNNPYAVAGPFNTLCGEINIYNFLADSFRYNRADDEGYLIARIFINKDRKFFVEGKGMAGYGADRFGEAELTEETMMDIIERAIAGVLAFDLYATPFDRAARLNVEQVNTKVENSKIETGKRLGFEYDTKDVY